MAPRVNSHQDRVIQETPSGCPGCCAGACKHTCGRWTRARAHTPSMTLEPDRLREDIHTMQRPLLVSDLHGALVPTGRILAQIDATKVKHGLRSVTSHTLTGHTAQVNARVMTNMNKCYNTQCAEKRYFFFLTIASRTKMQQVVVTVFQANENPCSRCLNRWILSGALFYHEHM